ncbi:MAG: PaaI family thioesterase [Ruminococcaceae bacterium]|nr:PaaI family thioesterase [Oscillospiraceae bacterium]
MRELNPEHVKAAIEYCGHAPFSKLISFRLTALEKGGVSRLELDLQDKHMNPEGGPHGGVYAIMVDEAAWWAVYAALDEDAAHTTVDLHVDDLGKAMGGTLYAEARVKKMGRTICLAECDVRDACGKLLVHGTSKLMVVPGLATVAQTMAKLGLSPVPPKFMEV